MFSLSTLAVVLAALSAVNAQDGIKFRFRMAARHLMYARLDPIISPGKVSAHVHTIIGGSRFRDELDSTETMLTGNCTSVAIQHDKSNYWTPTLYFINADGTFSPVGSNTLIYYQSTFPNVQAFPAGFRMIAGEAMERNYGKESIKGVKLEAKNMPQGHGNHFVNHTVPDDFRTRVFFPNCGLASQALDDPDDHFSHMACPIHGVANDWSINGPACPDTHPIIYPQILIETFYSLTDAQKKAWRPKEANLAWSNGDTAGSSFHADFVNGWDNDALQKYIDRGIDSISGKNLPQNKGEGNNMAAAFGEPEPYNPYDYCRMEGQLPAEDIGWSKPLAKLPGCNELWGWEQMTKPKCAAPAAPGYATPNLLFDKGTYNFPAVVPGAKSPADLAAPWEQKWTAWPGPVNGTQEAVDAAAQGGSAHPKVIGLDGVPAFYATTPTKTVNRNAALENVAKTHFPGKMQCPSPGANGGLPCAPPESMEDANSNETVATATAAPVNGAPSAGVTQFNTPTGPAVSGAGSVSAAPSNAASALTQEDAAHEVETGPATSVTPAATLPSSVTSVTSGPATMSYNGSATAAPPQLSATVDANWTAPASPAETAGRRCKRNKRSRLARRLSPNY